MTEIWNLNTLCRCCHADGSFSNLNSPCDVMGSNELCSVLLKDIFGIQLHSPSIEVSHMICDKCIKHLQDGAMFKKQVMECELKFQEYCKNELLQNMNIKLEQDEEDTSFVVKTETVMEYEATKLKRSEKWSAEEKDILREMIAHSRHIIEDNSSKASTNIKKAQEWKNIEKKINELMGKNWSAGDVKLAWKRMKLEAKANSSARRQYQMKKGGGEKPKSPSQDLAIMNIDPHDFVEEYTDCDSDPEKTVVELNPPEDSVTTAGPSTGFPPIKIEPPSATTTGPSTGFSPIIREPSSATTAGSSTGFSPIIREPSSSTTAGPSTGFSPIKIEPPSATTAGPSTGFSPIKIEPPSATTAGPSTGFSPIIREPSSSTTAGPSTGFSPIIREPSSATTAGPRTGISPIIREPSSATTAGPSTGCSPIIREPSSATTAGPSTGISPIIREPSSATTAGPSTGCSPIIREPSSATTAGPSTGFSPIIREPSSATTAEPRTGISPIIREPAPEFKDEVEKVMMDQGTSKVNVLTTGTSTPRKKENISRKQSCEKVPQRIKEAMRNIELKKKQIHMLQVEHQYFDRIAKLKIKILELEKEKMIRLKEL